MTKPKVKIKRIILIRNIDNKPKIVIVDSGDSLSFLTILQHDYLCDLCQGILDGEPIDPPKQIRTISSLKDNGCKIQRVGLNKFRLLYPVPEFLNYDDSKPGAPAAPHIPDA